MDTPPHTVDREVSDGIEMLRGSRLKVPPTTSQDGDPEMPNLRFPAPCADDRDPHRPPFGLTRRKQGSVPVVPHSFAPNVGH